MPHRISSLKMSVNDLFTHCPLIFISTCFLLLHFTGVLQNDHDFEKYSYNIYENQAVIDMFFAETLRAFREVVSTWDEFQNHLDRINKFIDNFCAIGSKCYVPNKPGNGYNILNHGDFHLRNLLVKFNEESQRLEKFLFVRSFD